MYCVCTELLAILQFHVFLSLYCCNTHLIHLAKEMIGVYLQFLLLGVSSCWFLEE